MPFHVEISSPVNRARVLNLGEDDLRRTVLGPWVAGLPFQFGDRDWAPRDSRLTILEGPAIDSADGDGSWPAALRAAEDVTRAMLEVAEASAPPQTAVVVEADSVETALEELRGGGPTQQISWPTAVERIGNRDPEVTAVILVVRPPGLSWPQH
jgi:hypothetical protein